MKAVQLYYVNGKRVDKSTFESTYVMIKEHFISGWQERWNIAGRNVYISKIEY